MKRQATTGGKYFHIPYLIKDIYPEYLTTLNTQQGNKKPKEKWAKD